MLQSSADITKLLGEIRRGNRNAESELAAVVHEELRLIAARLMRRERTNHTLQPTALVNEAYVRLLNAPDQDWKDRAHFFGVAAQIMRRILVDSARAYRAEKRNGNRTRLQLHDVATECYRDVDQVIAVDSALNKLAEWDPRQSRIVELRFFVGLSEEEIAEVLHVSTRTVKRDWRVARAWLKNELDSPAQSAKEV
ncbi:MAG TPA: sigma-70 family RNA polymerase sigma factor [Candidatus Solibacter sp.]|nr:sigma-70 family RNA polymerase sigma factor [Candidatus Solibacter sp.]